MPIPDPNQLAKSVVDTAVDNREPPKRPVWGHHACKNGKRRIVGWKKRDASV